MAHKCGGSGFTRGHERAKERQSSCHDVSLVDRWVLAHGNKRSGRDGKEGLILGSV